MLRRLQELQLQSDEEQVKCDSFARLMTEHLDGEQAGVRTAQQKVAKARLWFSKP